MFRYYLVIAEQKERAANFGGKDRCSYLYAFNFFCFVHLELPSVSTNIFFSSLIINLAFLFFSHLIITRITVLTWLQNKSRKERELCVNKVNEKFRGFFFLLTFFCFSLPSFLILLFVSSLFFSIEWNYSCAPLILKFSLRFFLLIELLEISLLFYMSRLCYNTFFQQLYTRIFGGSKMKLKSINILLLLIIGFVIN
jgi:hypothetical protein